ncbi:Capsule biosynthesis protein CapB [Planctomycetes bacterium Pan216]|uniref:Capsule biosynthesis protein CapB n=1 Tax=Kolteria novifilia TaxID=2527975 RepID=A0A518AX39_9BACT|nr:Capsule biosynthesis protein CapB [Planctomycetes bacterium Pan216]
MDRIAIVLGLTLLVTGWGIAEALLHLRSLLRIPFRIHVNGTRGKSSVTRLIAAGLRAGGIRTCAKTTGTLPRMIMPDGKEYPIYRPSRANVIEQVRIIDNAREIKAEAMVIECMALIPFLQWLSELHLVRGTHGVITNARADHLDVMGPDETDVAKALAGMVPRRGKLFTAERRHLDIFQMASDDRGTQLIPITAEEVAGITEEDLGGFVYTEHAENVALALRVCEDLGVDRATALRGMWEASPDPGAMTTHQLDFFGRSVIFVNGFAANDPESTERIWDMALQKHPGVSKRVAVFNCRADRPDRSLQLARACVTWTPADHYVLIGTGTYIFAKFATEAGLDPLRVIFAEDRRVEEIFESILDLGGKSCLVMGMGNIGGPGLPLVRFFRNRSTYQEASAST